MADLESQMALIIRALELPDPEREYRFLPRCCEHPKAKHAPEGQCRGCFEGGVMAALESRHVYDAGRRFRFDFAWPDDDRKLAVEVEGGIFTGKAHGSVSGILRDVEKYNLAMLAGWRILRVTPTMIDDGTALEMLEQAWRM